MGCSSSKIHEGGGESSTSPSDGRAGGRGAGNKQHAQQSRAGDAASSSTGGGARRGLTQHESDALYRPLGPDPYGKSLHNVMKDVEVRGRPCS
jgi:hypothetical protein